MKKIYLIILISLQFINGFSQEISFDIQNKNISEFLKIERELKSEKISNDTKHISFSGEAQPIKFIRKEKIIPNLIVEYYYKEKDSMISKILYEWDVSNFNKELNNQKGKKFRKELAEKFLCLEKKITKEFGKPTQEGELDEETEINIKDKYQKNDKWIPNDNTEIEMYIIMSNLYKKSGMATTTPTHRIRLYVKSKKKTIEPKLGDQKIIELDLSAREFLKTLEQKDFEKSKTYFSEIIINQVNEKVMNELYNSIDFKKEFELLHTGIQIGMNGKKYLMFNYKYKDDLENPPLTMIKFVFDDNDKIIGFRPMARGDKVNK